MKRLTGIVLAVTSAFAIDNAVITNLRDKLVENDVAVCLDDKRFTKTTTEDNCDGNIDVHLTTNGMISSNIADTSATYDLLIRVDKRDYCDSEVHMVGIDDVLEEFNKDFIETPDNFPGDNIYKVGLENEEIDSLSNEWVCTPVNVGHKEELKKFDYTIEKPGKVNVIFKNIKGITVHKSDKIHEKSGSYNVEFPKELSKGKYFFEVQYEN